MHSSDEDCELDSEEVDFPFWPDFDFDWFFSHCLLNNTIIILLRLLTTIDDIFTIFFHQTIDNRDRSKLYLILENDDCNFVFFRHAIEKYDDINIIRDYLVLFFAFSFEDLDDLQMLLHIISFSHFDIHKLTYDLEQRRLRPWIIFLLQDSPHFRRINHIFDVDHNRGRYRCIDCWSGLLRPLNKIFKLLIIFYHRRRRFRFCCSCLYHIFFACRNWDHNLSLRLFLISLDNFPQISFIEDPLQLLCPIAVICFGEFIDIVDGWIDSIFADRYGKLFIDVEICFSLFYWSYILEKSFSEVYSNSENSLGS